MLNDEPVLVADSSIYHGLDLCAALEHVGARIIGPASTVAEALELLDAETAMAAIVDCEMPDDVQPLLRLLTRRGTPFVMLCSSAVTSEVSGVRAGAPIIVKPIRADHIASILMGEVLRVGSMRLRE